jgi:hypothetical protein
MISTSVKNRLFGFVMATNWTEEQEKWKTTMFYDYNVREQFTKHCMRKCAPSTRQNNGSEINKKVKNGRIKNLMCKKDVD